MFSNTHLDLPYLRRCKVNLLSIVTDGKYPNKTMEWIIKEDVEYATYLGDCVDNNWTWPVLQLWKKYVNKKKWKEQNAKDKALPKHKKIKLKPNYIFKFGKYKGKKVSTVKLIDRQYIDWLNKETKYYVR